MKKLYTLLAAAFVGIAAIAQTGRMSGPVSQPGQIAPGSVNVQPLAPGDTLLYIPFLDIYVNTTDQPNFQYATEDLDGFTTTTTNNYPSDWFYVYWPLNFTWNYHPWETPGVDTSFSAGA